MAGVLGLFAMILLLVLAAAYNVACGLAQGCDTRVWPDLT
jgi:hypothetical protein